MYFGCHLSAGKGAAAMVETARSIGANTFAFLPGIPGEAKQNRKIPPMRPRQGTCWKNMDLASW